MKAFTHYIPVHVSGIVTVLHQLPNCICYLWPAVIHQIQRHSYTCLALAIFFSTQFITIFIFHDNVLMFWRYLRWSTLNNAFKFIRQTLNLHVFVLWDVNLASNVVSHIADIVTLEVFLEKLLLVLYSLYVCNAQLSLIQINHIRSLQDESFLKNMHGLALECLHSCLSLQSQSGHNNT